MSGRRPGSGPEGRGSSPSAAVGSCPLEAAAAGGGGRGGGREQGGRSPPASVRHGSTLASERKESPAPPPRPLLPLLSQQRGERHSVALRNASLFLASPRPAPSPLRGVKGDPTALPHTGSAPQLERSRFRLRSLRRRRPLDPFLEEAVASPSPREGLVPRPSSPVPPRGCSLPQALEIYTPPTSRWGSGLLVHLRVILGTSWMLSQNSCPGH